MNYTIKIKKAIEEFNNYVKNFDFSNDMISKKYYHTFRVIDYAKSIAESEKLNEHDIYLSIIIALLHDIGRFEQAKIYNTFIDLKSIDHGDLGYKILLENNYISKYIDNELDKNIVLTAIKNHNKYEIDKSLTDDRTIYFCKIIRDADKLDILDKQRNEINDNIKTIDSNTLEYIKSQKLFKRNGNISNDASKIVQTLTFIFDLNFKKSFEIIKEQKIIDRKIDVLYNFCDSNIIDNIKEIIDTGTGNLSTI